MNFLRDLRVYDKDNIPVSPHTLKKTPQNTLLIHSVNTAS